MSIFKEIVLLEKEQHNEKVLKMKQHLQTNYDVMDEDMGNVFVFRCKDTDFTFEARLGNTVEVHSHQDKKEAHKKAEEIRKDLMDCCS